VLSAAGERAGEARASAETFGAELDVQDFRDAFFRYGGEVKEFFEELKGRIEPDLLLTHHDADRHQDHRLVAELTWNTFRDHLILEYEIPKIRRRPWGAERLRPAGGGLRAAQSRAAARLLRHTAREALVHRGRPHGPDADPRDGVPRGERPRRGVSRPASSRSEFV
jgi:LmbE family N-acetylglucosaminyl deacetylase